LWARAWVERYGAWVLVVLFALICMAVGFVLRGCM
jgi:hypothetical protein